MDIKCRRTCCEYNKGQTCCAARVDITQKAICKTFEKNEKIDEKSLDLSCHMFETAPEYANSRHIKNVVLKCDACHCLFNACGKCRANGITVVDQDEHSKCGSFIYNI